jgi:hypothetical protein
MIANKIEKLKKAADKKEMLVIFDEIKVAAGNITYPSLSLKKQMLDMLSTSIEIYIEDRYRNNNSEVGNKILDTFAILDTL